MKPPFDLAKLRARAAVLLHDPRAPTDDSQQHLVRLLPITSNEQLHARWQEAQDWCRREVRHELGDRWSRRMERDSDQPVFSFSDASTSMMFALLFR